MQSVLTLLLASSAVAQAMPGPDWSRAGTTGLVVYAVVTLGLALIERGRDAAHRDDCAQRLIDLQAAVGTLLERGGAATPLQPDGRPAKP